MYRPLEEHKINILQTHHRQLQITSLRQMTLVFLVSDDEATIEIKLLSPQTRQKN